MKSIRLHFAYHHVEKPWGGANNFIRSLRHTLTKNGGFIFVNEMEAPCDVLFMNQLGKGPAGGKESYDLDHIRRLQHGSISLRERLRGRGHRSPRKLVVRAVNLNQHAFRYGLRNRLFGARIDRRLLALLQAADLTVFQSAYQRDFFVTAGYRGDNSTVIHNGADGVYWRKEPTIPPLTESLKLISVTASPRASKRHDLIARISLLPGVEVLHFGNWPENLDTGRVQLMKMADSRQIVRAMEECHYYLHPAIKDPCPNAIFEAICAGLPVIYHAGPGSSAEIVGENGFALNENNLTILVDMARGRYQELRALVLANRSYYTIGRAANEYSEAFRTCVSGR